MIHDEAARRLTTTDAHGTARAYFERYRSSWIDTSATHDFGYNMVGQPKPSIKKQGLLREAVKEATDRGVLQPIAVSNAADAAALAKNSVALGSCFLIPKKVAAGEPEQFRCIGDQSSATPFEVLMAHNLPTPNFLISRPTTTQIVATATYLKNVKEHGEAEALHRLKNSGAMKKEFATLYFTCIDIVSMFTAFWVHLSDLSKNVIASNWDNPKTGLKDFFYSLKVLWG